MTSCKSGHAGRALLPDLGVREDDAGARSERSKSVRQINRQGQV